MLSYKRLGDNLRLAREQNGLYKKDVAKLAGTSQQHYGAIEGGTAIPSLDLLEGICTALGITILDALAGASDNRGRNTPIDRQFVENIKCLSLHNRQLLYGMARLMIEQS